MSIQRILIHSGKHPFTPFDYTLDYERTMLACGKNLGNLLFADAIYKYLYTSQDVEMESDAYGFPGSSSEMTAEAINERYDCVVLPAANWLAENSGPRLQLFAKKIRKLKIPCVLIGIGVQSWGQEDLSFLENFSKEATEFLNAIADHSHSISVRGEFTARCLRKLGFTAVNVTGCPSFYRGLRTPTPLKEKSDRDSFNLAVNGVNSLLLKPAKELFETHPSVFFSQGDIIKIMKQKWGAPWPDLRYALGDGFTMKMISEGRVRYFGDIAPWIEELKKFSFSIGTRIHGNILALLAGVPAMVLAHDSRTSEMAHFFKIPTVPLNSLKKGFDPYELYESADYTAMFEEYPQKLANMAGFLEANQLSHTLNEENGSTYYDEKIRQLDLKKSEHPSSDAFFKVGGVLSLAISKLKSLRAEAAHQVESSRA